MHVDLDARVLTSDGHDVGRVKHAIIDPRNHQVAAFVINTSWIFGRDVLIARQEIESATSDGDSIRLEMTRDLFDDLPSFIPSEYDSPPADYRPEPPYDYPAPAFRWPISYSGTTLASAVAMTDPETESPGIDQGSRVVDRNGDDVGVVEDLLFDAEDGNLRALVVTLGGGLRRLFGAGRTAKISASLVESVEGSVVHLRTVKEQVEANS
jgi:sporulation protein YlmC with PRC-barrel domain